MPPPISGYPPDATATVRGLVNTTAQTFSGDKTVHGVVSAHFLDARGSLVPDGAFFQVTAGVFDSLTAYDATPNTGIAFGGYRNAGSGINGGLSGMAGIGFAKANATSDDCGGILTLWTRPTGDGSGTSQLKRGQVQPNGKLLWGTATESGHSAIVQVAGAIESTSGGFTFPDGTTQTTAASGGISGSGSAGKVTFWTGSSAVDDATELYWDNTVQSLGIWMSPVGGSFSLEVSGSVYTDSSFYADPTLAAGFVGHHFQLDDTSATQSLLMSAKGDGSLTPTFSSSVVASGTHSAFDFITANTLGSGQAAARWYNGSSTLLWELGLTALTFPDGTTQSTAATGGGLPVDAPGYLKNNGSGSLSWAFPAFSEVTGAVAAAQLPNPSASTLGGVQSYAAVTNQWIRSISTSGVPASSQPAFTDISGSVAAAQLPNPGASSLGGVQSKASASHQFLTQISTSGVVSAAQPAPSDLSGWPSNSSGVLTNDGSGTLSWGAAGSGVTTLAAVGSSPNANAGTISGSTLTLQPASASFPGVMSAAHYSLLAGAASLSTASTLVLRDSSGNAQFNNAVQGYATTATAGATTTLTVADKWEQRFTGSLTQTVRLPDCTTLATGVSYYIVNRSSGAVTVQDSSGGPLGTLRTDAMALFVCTSIASAAGAWDTCGGISVLAAFGSTPNANGATITGVQLTLQPADGSNPGGVTNGSQTFGGQKTFAGVGTPLVVSSTDSVGTFPTLTVTNNAGSNGTPAINFIHNTNDGGSVIGWGTTAAFGNIHGINLYSASNAIGFRISSTSVAQVNGNGLMVTGSGCGLAVGTAGTVPQGQAWFQKSNSGALGADVWVANSASSAVGNECAYSWGSDGTTDATPNARLSSIVTNAGSFLADLVVKLYDGSALSEKWRFTSGSGGSVGDFYGQEGAKLGFNGSGLTSYIQGSASTHGLIFKSNTTAASSNTAFLFNSTNTLSGSDLLIDIQNNGTSKFKVKNDGVVTAVQILCGQQLIQGAQFQPSGNTTAIFYGTTNDGAGNVGAKIGCSNGGTAMSNATARLVSVQNNSTEKAAFYADGRLGWPTGGAADVIGTATLSGGTVTVSTTAVKSTSLVFLTHGGSSTTNAGTLTVGTVTAGTSFVINSTNASDNDTVNWIIHN